MKSFEQHQADRRRRSITRHRRAGGASAPPAGRSNLVLAFDPAAGYGAQTHRSVIGPTGTLGSLTSADTNDPTHSVATPPSYLFGVDDYIDFGDSLDSTFMSAFGFSILVGMNPAAGDVAATRGIIAKYDGVNVSFYFNLIGGFPRLFVSYDTSFGKYDEYTDNVGAVTTGRQVHGVTFDPGAARATRAAIYRNGLARTYGNTFAGVTGTVLDSTSALRIVQRQGGSVQSVAEIGPVYIWNAKLSAADMLTNSSWLAGRGWA